MVVGNEVAVLQGCGLGGGSLINANVGLDCDPRVLEDEVSVSTDGCEVYCFKRHNCKLTGFETIRSTTGIDWELNFMFMWYCFEDLNS